MNTFCKEFYKYDECVKHCKALAWFTVSCRLPYSHMLHCLLVIPLWRPQFWREFVIPLFLFLSYLNWIKQSYCVSTHRVNNPTIHEYNVQTIYKTYKRYTS